MTIIINLVLILLGSSLAIMTSRFQFFSIPYFHTFFSVLYIFFIFLVLWRSHKKNKHYLKYLTLSFFPVYVVLFGAFYLLESDIKQIALAIISFGLLVFFLYMIEIALKSSIKKEIKLFKFENKLELTMVIVLGLVFTFLVLFGISKQALVDEPLWMFNHVEKYSDKIFSGDLRYSTPHDKPGVPIAILGSSALLKYPNPSELKKGIDSNTYLDLATSMRIPIALFICLIFPLFYLVSKQIFNYKTSLLIFASLSLSPLLIGISRIINPDALIWIFMPLTFLSFMLSIYKNNSKLIILTGLFFGSALLTKYIANIFFVFFIPIIFIYFILTISKSKEISLALRKALKVYFTVSLIAITEVFVFLPATWVNLKSLLVRTIWSQAFEPIWLPFVLSLIVIIYDVFFRKNSLIVNILIKLSSYKKIIMHLITLFFVFSVLFIFYTSHMHSIFDYTLSLTSPKSSVKNIGFLGTFFASFYVLYYGVSAFSLLGFVSGLVFMLKEKSKLAQSTIFSILLFIPFYFIGSTISGVLSVVRYQIALYPIFFVISGYGLYKLFSLFDKKYFPALTLFYVGILSISLWQVVPYYSSFNSALLPKDDILNVKDIGDGSYQVAQYLNNLDNAKDLIVWSDKRGVCYVFIGKCSSSVDISKFARENAEFDYFVASTTKANLMTRKIKRELRRKNVPKNPLPLLDLYNSNNSLKSEFEIILGTNKYNKIKVINSKDLN